jgi:hypothetical protein
MLGLAPAFSQRIQKMRLRELTVDRKSVANLADVWAAIDTPIYRVVDEEGENVGDAQLRALDSKRFIYVDSLDGYRIVTQEEIGFVEIVLDGKQIHTIQVWLANNLEDYWAYSVSDCDGRELARGTVDLDLHAHLDDVVDLVLYELAIDGVTHDDFAKSPEDGGYAIWSR